MTLFPLLRNGGPRPNELRYAFGTDIESPDLTTGFVDTFANLSGQTLTIENALEIPGGGSRLDVVPEQRAVVVRNREQLGIQRLEIGADGRVQPGEFVSFAGVGVTNINGLNVMVEDDLALYWGTVDRLLVRWNPTTMEILGTQVIEIENPDPALYEFFVIRPATGEITDGIMTAPVTWQSGPLLPTTTEGRQSLSTTLDLAS